MPGHMNLLLAEADIAYKRLKEMDEVNASMDQVYVAIRLGANDVVNPLRASIPAVLSPGLNPRQHAVETVENCRGSPGGTNAMR